MTLVVSNIYMEFIFLTVRYRCFFFFFFFFFGGGFFFFFFFFFFFVLFFLFFCFFFKKEGVLSGSLCIFLGFFFLKVC